MAESVERRQGARSRRLSRRGLLSGVAVLAVAGLAACGEEKTAEPPETPDGPPKGSLEWAVAGPWRDYRAHGALPDLSALSYVARAITPPGRARRFDARFFMADGSALLSRDIDGSGELDEIAWIPLEEAEALDLPAITRFVVGEVAKRLSDPDRPAPFVRFVRGRHDIQSMD